jgi:hypothetical protein
MGDGKTEQLCNSVSIMANKKTPTDFLENIIGKPVNVKLNSGVEYRGRVTLDHGWMWMQTINVALP